LSPEINHLQRKEKILLVKREKYQKRGLGDSKTFKEKGRKKKKGDDEVCRETVHQ